MNDRSQRSEEAKSTPRSSMSVFKEELCQDEACIGKDASLPSTDPKDADASDKKRNQASGTRMSVGGQEACVDDACIGKS